MPTNRCPILALLILVLAAAPTWSAAPAPQTAQAANTSSISGMVFDPSNRPVPNLWLELMDEVNSIIARTRTDGTGRYHFRGLSNGIFQVRPVVTGTPYVTQVYRVALVSSWQSVGTRSVNELLDVYLRPAEERAAGAPRGGVVFAQDVPEGARKAFGQAVSQLDERKDTEAGIGGLKQALDIFPAFFQALERLGLEYVRLGRHEEAVPVLAKALEVNPSGHDSLYALGVAQYRLKRYPESIEALTKMTSAVPESANAAFAEYFLGLALVRAGRQSDGEPHLKKAYGEGGKSIPADVHMALAQIYSSTRRYREAAAELELYLKEAPDAGDPEKIRTLIKQLREKAR